MSGVMLVAAWMECEEYSHTTLHCMTSYMYSFLTPICAFPWEGHITRAVRRQCNIARVLVRTVLSIPPDTYRYAQ
jgi:hypothetical protein